LLPVTVAVTAKLYVPASLAAFVCTSTYGVVADVTWLVSQIGIVVFGSVLVKLTVKA
jgi:hypothetical protein